MKETMEEVEEIKKELNQDTFAIEIIKDCKNKNIILQKTNQRLFIIWIITFIAFVCLLGYTIWLLNDIGVIEEKQEISDINSIENSSIANGDIYGENKAN